MCVSYTETYANFTNNYYSHTKKQCVLRTITKQGIVYTWLLIYDLTKSQPPINQGGYGLKTVTLSVKQRHNLSFKFTMRAMDINV